MNHPSDGDTTEVIQAYFSEKASTYDAVGDDPYWRLSDDLLWQILELHVLTHVPSANARILDAGAGTGRWSVRLLEALPHAKAVLADFTEAMRGQSLENLRAAGVNDRADVVAFDLNHDSPSNLGGFDLVICFHNVLGFVFDPDATLRNLWSAVNPGGTLAVVAPNFYHAYYFSLRGGRLEEALRIRNERRVRFSAGPAMRVFTAEDLESSLASLGADVTSLGFPVTIYPDATKVAPELSDSLSTRLLADPASRAAIYDIEVELSQRPSAASRGNNLLVVARRSI